MVLLVDAPERALSQLLAEFLQETRCQKEAAWSCGTGWTDVVGKRRARGLSSCPWWTHGGGDKCGSGRDEGKKQQTGKEEFATSRFDLQLAPECSQWQNRGKPSVG